MIVELAFITSMHMAKGSFRAPSVRSYSTPRSSTPRSTTPKTTAPRPASKPKDSKVSRPYTNGNGQMVYYHNYYWFFGQHERCYDKNHKRIDCKEKQNV